MMTMVLGGLSAATSDERKLSNGIILKRERAVNRERERETSGVKEDEGW